MSAWGVWRDGMAGTVTFGPFLPEGRDGDDGRKAAERFVAQSEFGGNVYNMTENAKSLCGPWLP
jgi:hypothetical protein